MQKIVIILLTCLIGGCASATRPAAPAETLARPHYHDATALALAFTPTVALDEPPVFLPRDIREPAIFVGFDEITTSFFYIRTDDRQSDDFTDRYLRRAVIEQVGVRYR